MQDVLGDDLEGDRGLRERRRQRGCVGGAAQQGERRYRDAVIGEKLQRLRLEQAAAVLGEGMFDDRRCRRVFGGSRRLFLLGLGGDRHLVEALGAGETGRGDLDRAHDDDVAGAQDVDRLRRELRVVALHDDRLAGPLGQLHQVARRLVLDLGDPGAIAHLIAAEIADDQQGIDGGVGEDLLAAERHVARMRVGAAAGVDRVGELAGGRRDELQPRLGVGGEAGQG